MAHLIIGTAGHIDHGKSTLVRALTGIDPDRLREEKERGMTIDLGFAFLGDRIAFIDVPGHERFIKNMVAGVSAIDMAMLVVAADDGMMPQTREHIDILSLLNVRLGCLVINKIDLAEPEFVDLVEEELRSAVRDTFLQDAPVFRISAATGEGIESLRRHLLDVADKTEQRPDRGLFWMPIDRAFTVKGFGTVVTGSVVSGKARLDDRLELLPDRCPVRLRGIQSHGKTVTQVGVGERAALNLNLPREQLERGKTLAAADMFTPSTLFDVQLTLLKSAQKPLKNRSRVRLHIGTRETLCRVKLLDCNQLDPGHQSFAQLLLEEPAVALRREPFVIRRYSPMLTIGGGMIIDANPPRHKRMISEVIDQLRNLLKQDPQEICEIALLQNDERELSGEQLQKNTGLQTTVLQAAMESLVRSEQVCQFGSGNKSLFYHRRNSDRLQERIVAELDSFHRREPLRPDMSKAEIKEKIASQMNPRVFDSLLARCAAAKQIQIQPTGIKLPQHDIRLTDDEEKTAKQIEKVLNTTPFAPPTLQETAAAVHQPVEKVARLLGALQGLGRVLRLEDDLYYTAPAIQKAEQLLREHGKLAEEISVSQFRDLLGATRKYTLALLTYFDTIGRTERVGEVRVIRFDGQSAPGNPQTAN